MPRVSKDPEVRKQEILEAAIILFYEKGYDKTNMADIASKIGVAQGLCYRYFPSKEFLFNAALEAYAQSMVDSMAAYFNNNSLTLKQKLQQMPSSIDYEQKGSSYYNAFHNENAESKRIHDQLSLKVCELVTPFAAKAFKLAYENGEIDIPDYETAASFCTYGQLGIILNDTLNAHEKTQRIQEQMSYYFRL